MTADLSCRVRWVDDARWRLALFVRASGRIEIGYIDEKLPAPARVLFTPPPNGAPVAIVAPVPRRPRRWRWSGVPR